MKKKKKHETIDTGDAVTISPQRGRGLQQKYVNVCLRPPFSARARKAAGKKESWRSEREREREETGRIKKDGGREAGSGGGRVSGGTGEVGWGVYIINYDFITCSQFLGDLLFRGALMNNKRRRRQRERGGEEGKKRWVGRRRGEVKGAA